MDPLPLLDVIPIVPRDDEDEDQVAGHEPDGEALSYARELIEGVQAHHAEIDALISEHARDWEIERMPIIDRNILRVAIFELRWGADLPVAVAINEAVVAAKELSTESSGRFLNGLLGRVAEDQV